MRSSAIGGVEYKELAQFPDERGRFVEVVRTSEVEFPLAQMNHSRSVEGVLRGLHFHCNQDDLWYLASGTIQVALVDLRPRGGAPQVETLELDSEHPATLYIPRGVAHGFCSLTSCDLFYWVTQEFDGSDEFGIHWNDSTLAVPWAIPDPLISPRDASNPEFSWDQIPSF